jgi:hypothetical protein
MMAKTTTGHMSREDWRKTPDLASLVHKNGEKKGQKSLETRPEKDSLRTSHDAILPKENKKRNKHKPPRDQSRRTKKLQ